MKKIICCAVGLIFLAVAVVFAISETIISVGAGDKTTLSISTPDEFISVLNGGNSSETDSYTLTENNEHYNTYTSKTSSSTTSRKISADSTATYYSSGNETYCTAEGVYSYSYEYDYNNTDSGIRTSRSSAKKYYIDYNFSYYTDGENCYVYFDKFDLQRAEESSYSVYSTTLSIYTSSENDNEYTTWDFYSIVNSWLGQWIDCSESSEIIYVLDSLIELSSQAETVLENVEDAIDSDLFVKVNDYYSAEKTQDVDSATAELKVTLDLSDEIKPEATYNYFVSYVETLQGNTVNSYLYKYGEVILSNINNSTIALGDVTNIIAASTDDVATFIEELEKIV